MSVRKKASASPEHKGRRRLPSRKRGQMTVDCILEAAEQIICEQGNADTTTNKIADRAGVSISSLYQYFANKEAIFLALYYRATSEVAAILREATVQLVDRDTEEAIPLLVKTALKAIEAHQYPLFHLAESVPELRQGGGGLSMARLIYEGSRVYMERHFNSRDFKDAELIYYFIESTVFSSIRNYLLSRPEHISRARFIRELSRMLVNYLKDFERR